MVGFVDADMRLRILIVEDDPRVRGMFGLFLEAAGHSVVIAPRGRDGVELALLERPHAVIVDIGLPDIDGYDVARRLRRNLGRDLILLAVTGREDTAEPAAAAGFDVHVLKPVEPERLLGLIEGAASGLRGCPACGEPLLTPFPEHLRVCSVATRAAIEWSRMISEQVRATQKRSRQLRDAADVSSAESETLKDQAKKVRGQEPPT
jgi:DNA-binding response OmpR family regulator